MNRLLLPGVRLLLAALALQGGCAPAVPPSPPTSGRTLLIGIDTSGSARSHLGAYVLVTETLAEHLTVGQDRLTLFRLDRAIQEFSDGTYSGDSEAQIATLVAEVKRLSTQARTYPLHFWETATERAERSPQPLVIVLLSDGDNDDARPETSRALAALGTRLARCRQVQAVGICGVTPGNWAALRTAFAPLGHRLHLWSPTQLSDESIPTLLAEARQ